MKNIAALILGFLTCVLGGGLPTSLHAAQEELRLSGLFADHAILQRDMKVPVWGWAAPGTNVSVEFGNEKLLTTADDQGTWRVALPAMAASKTGRTLTVSAGKEKITRRDILVGDVWLCAGQSNMQLSLRVCAKTHPPLKQLLDKADNSLLRLGPIPHTWPAEPLSDVACNWQPANSISAKSFSAAGYIFGTRIQKELDIPIGLIEGSHGGTWIENWLPREDVETSESCKGYMNQFKKEQRGIDDYRRPGSLFNGMIAPIAGFALKGVLWYQGEGNVSEFSVYDKKICALMNRWRSLWQQPELPFILTELAPYGDFSEIPQDSARSRFGENLAQAAKSDGNAWTVTITDGGMMKDIHPPFKEIPGERYAAMALSKVYGKPGIAHGPKLDSWTCEGSAAVVTFSSVGEGLEVRDVTLDGHELSAKQLVGFELADENRRFFRASARLDGKNRVIVTCPDVAKPAAVRYAWGAFPLCNLYNKSGFATYPFRTDEWPWQTPKNRKNEEGPLRNR
jgi:sialate O-acetylesterase